MDDIENLELCVNDLCCCGLALFEDEELENFSQNEEPIFELEI